MGHQSLKFQCVIVILKHFAVFGQHIHCLYLQDVIWLQSRLKGSWFVTDQFESFDHSTFNTGVEIEKVHRTVEAIIKASEENKDPEFPREIPMVGR